MFLLAFLLGLALPITLLGVSAAIAARRWRTAESPPPHGPPIYRESAASGREVGVPINRYRGANRCLLVEVYDDQVRLAIPQFLDRLLPIESTTGMPTAILRHRIQGAYSHGDRVLVEFSDARGRQRGVELKLRYPERFLAALIS